MKIAVKLRVLAVVLVVVSALAVGVSFYVGFQELLEQQHRDHLELHTSTQALRLETACTVLRNDVRFLGDLPAIRLLNSPATTDERAAWSLRSTVEIFEALMRDRPNYHQVRYLSGRGGREVVRIERRDGDVRRVPEEELQEKGHRSYFREGLLVPEGEVHFSPVDLNRERGEIQVPNVATLRASTPIRIDGQTLGLIVINVDFDSLLRHIYREVPAGHTYYVCDERGEFLSHPDQNLTYASHRGFDFGLYDQFPEFRGVSESTETRTVVVPARGSTSWSLVRLHRAPVFPGEDDRHLTLIVARSGRELESSVSAILKTTLVAAVLVVGAAMAVAYLLALLLARPLARIERSAANLAQDREFDPLPTERTDEIGSLARAIDRMIKSLRDNEAQLRRSNEDLEQFAFTASHDLQEPLRMVSCYVDLLERSLGDRVRDSEREFMRYAKDGSQRMKDLVDGLLTMARVESRGDRFDLHSSDDILDAVLEDLAIVMAENEVRIVREPLPEIHADRSQIGRVFQNTLTNAMKFRGEATPEVIIQCRRDGEFWEFSVRDNGMGFDARYAERIFQIFHRLGSGDSKPGSGIGLSVSRRIVERHGGRMWAESAVGVGSVFYFTIPVRATAP